MINSAVWMCRMIKSLGLNLFIHIIMSLLLHLHIGFLYAVLCVEEACG